MQSYARFSNSHSPLAGNTYSGYVAPTHYESMSIAKRTMIILAEKIGHEVATNLCKKIRDSIKFTSSEQATFSKLIKELGFEYEGCNCRGNATHDICNFIFDLTNINHQKVALFLMQMILYTPHEVLEECDLIIELNWSNRIKDNFFEFGDKLLAFARGEKVINLPSTYNEISHCTGIGCEAHVTLFLMVKDLMFTAYRDDE